MYTRCHIFHPFQQLATRKTNGQGEGHQGTAAYQPECGTSGYAAQENPIPPLGASRGRNKEVGET